MRVVELDVRGLSHPEPLEKSVAAFNALKEGEALYLRIHRRPVPLLQIAANRGLRYESLQRGEGDYHFLFSRDPSCDLAEMLKELAGV